ncbi:MAG: murein biosynthesis integral membrane protein MurJ [Actinomycetota bacterium]|nr:murein biosynthesis integral membrane protein MurJ [Actinomycetota bacterium]
MTDRAEGAGPDAAAEVGSGLLRSSAVMAAGTMISRLVGFVRTAMVVAAVGATGLHADIFNYANTVPNMVYILVAGGVFNTVLVPQIVRSMKNDPDGGAAYVNRILTLSGIFLAGVTAVLVATAPWVMRALAGDQMFSPQLQAQTESFIDFARYCLPQVFFYGVFVLIGQVLNARRSFGPMMWAPITNNLVAIVVLAIYLSVFGGTSGSAPYSPGEELLLGLGSTLGIVVQTVVLVPYLRRAGVRYRPRFDFRGTGLGHTLRLGLWTVMFVIVNQVAYVVVGRIATNASATGALTGQASSGYTAYSYSYLLLMVPHAIVTVSLATAALPRLSSLSAEGRLRQVGQELNSTLRHSLTVIVPFCAVLAVLGPFLAVIMFSWGAASGDVAALGRTLVAFSPALFFFTVHYLMLRGFYALEDTRTPFVVQCVIAVANVTAALLYTDPTADPEVAPQLALAYATAYLVGAATSLLLLRWRVGDLRLPVLLRFLVRITAASVPAAGAAWLVVRGLSSTGLDPDAKAPALLILVAASVIALSTLVLLGRLLRLEEVTSIMRTVFGRLRRGG